MVEFEVEGSGHDDGIAWEMVDESHLPVVCDTVGVQYRIINTRPLWY